MNFLESREISLHRTTVNLKTDVTHSHLGGRCGAAAAASPRTLKWTRPYCDRTPASALPPEKRIISASLWNSSMDRAVSSARLLMAAAWTSWKHSTHTRGSESNVQKYTVNSTIWNVLKPTGVYQHHTSTETLSFTSSPLWSSSGLAMSVIWLQVFLQACWRTENMFSHFWGWLSWSYIRLE